MDVSAIMPMLYAELNAAGTADLVFWTVDELYRYADLALSDLSSRLMLFVDAQDLTGIAGQSAYDLAHTTDDTPVDTRFASLIHAVWGGASLSPANMREIEARDANWSTTTGAPTSWIGDWLATGMIMAYPQPAGGATLTVFCQRNAATVSAASPTLDAPAALEDWLHMKTLAEARHKRSDAWMEESAAMADQVGGLLEKAFQAYYGSGL